METTKKSTDTKLYYDVGKFKGNTFENNINTINKLYLGLGLKISELPYIYINESDNKTYLSANCFTIKTIKETNKTDLIAKAKEGEKAIYYPVSFLYNVFYDNNTIFYLDSNSQLNVYKFDKESLSVKHSLIQRDVQEEVQKNKQSGKTTDKLKDKKKKLKEKIEESTKKDTHHDTQIDTQNNVQEVTPKLDIDNNIQNDNNNINKKELINKINNTNEILVEIENENNNKIKISKKKK